MKNQSSVVKGMTNDSVNVMASQFQMIGEKQRKDGR
jgi:hypothetical protein